MQRVAEANSRGGSGWVRAMARYSGSTAEYNLWMVTARGPDGVLISVEEGYRSNFGVEAPQVAQDYANRIYDEITSVPPME